MVGTFEVVHFGTFKRDHCAYWCCVADIDYCSTISLNIQSFTFKCVRSVVRERFSMEYDEISMYNKALISCLHLLLIWNRKMTVCLVFPLKSNYAWEGVCVFVSAMINMRSSVIVSFLVRQICRSIPDIFAKSVLQFLLAMKVHEPLLNTSFESVNEYYYIQIQRATNIFVIWNRVFEFKKIKTRTTFFYFSGRVSMACVNIYRQRIAWGAAQRSG
jgi:hypothetical protein